LKSSPYDQPQEIFQFTTTDRGQILPSIQRINSNFFVIHFRKIKDKPKTLLELIICLSFPEDEISFFNIYDPGHLSFKQDITTEYHREAITTSSAILGLFGMRGGGTRAINQVRFSFL